MASQRVATHNQLTVVVVTYNSARLLPAFFAALPQGLAGVASSELVVVDNDSSDDTLAVVAERAPDATVVAMGRNAGYAAGLNAGVRAADPSDAVLLLNPDVRLGEGAAARLIATLEDFGCGITVPRLSSEDGTLAPSLRREPTVLRSFGEAVLGGRLAGRIPALGEVVRSPGRYAQPGEADWASGAAMLLSRSCLEAVGPWDESLFLYSEETDFALRARDAGFPLRFVPSAGAVHIGGDAPTSPRLWSLLAANKVVLFARRHGRLHTAAFWAVTMLNEGLRVLRGQATHRAAVRALWKSPHRPGAAWSGR